MTVDRFESFLATHEPFRVDATGQVEIANLEAVLSRIAPQRESAVAARQVSCSGKLIRNVWDANIRWKVVARAVFVTDDGAERWITQRRAGLVSREHVVRATLVSRFAVSH